MDRSGRRGCCSQSPDCVIWGSQGKWILKVILDIVLPTSNFLNQPSYQRSNIVKHRTVAPSQD